MKRRKSHANGSSMAAAKSTVYGRFAVLAFFVAFVVFCFAPSVLIVFGVIDVAAVTWTGIAIWGTYQL